MKRQKPLILLALLLCSACGRPGPVEPRGRVVPHDGLNFSGAEEVLVKEFLLTGIGLEMTEAAVAAQTVGRDNAVLLEHALRLALTSFLENSTEPTGPLAVTLKSPEISGLPPAEKPAAARATLLRAMNLETASLSLVAPGGPDQPPRGESTGKNWIFCLKLDRRPYWGVVPRSGENPPYIYGLK